jgi:hypothetical protein
MFSKKGSGYILGKKPVYFIIVVLFLSVSFLLFSFAISSNISTSNKIPENVRLTVMVNRFLNSPECLAYMDDETGRVYPGIVDLSNFDNKHMVNCYKGNDDSVAFSFEIEELDKECSTPNWGAYRFKRISQVVLTINEKGEISKQNMLISMQK